jgi:hypothetical protein
MISKDEPRESAAKEAATAGFLSNISRGVHAAAQPLTILRASFGKDQTDRMSLTELRELTRRSALEVERACTFFNFLQQLLICESQKPQLSTMPIEPLLAYVTDGVKLWFERDGIFLRSTVADSCQPVLINRARTLQALSSVLMVAREVSHVKDTIELFATPSSSHAVKIAVRNAKAYVDAMNEEASLSLALAEANLRSQQATCSWSLQPFSVQIELEDASRLDSFGQVVLRRDSNAI